MAGRRFGCLDLPGVARDGARRSRSPVELRADGSPDRGRIAGGRTLRRLPRRTRFVSLDPVRDAGSDRASRHFSGIADPESASTARRGSAPALRLRSRMRETLWLGGGIPGPVRCRRTSQRREERRGAGAVVDAVIEGHEASARRRGCARNRMAFAVVRAGASRMPSRPRHETKAAVRGLGHLRAPRTARFAHESSSCGSTARPTSCRRARQRSRC